MAVRGARALELGPAVPADAKAIAELSRRHVEVGLGWRWRAAQVASHIAAEDSCVVVARDGRGVRGFAVMEFHFEAADAHLLLLAVTPAHRRQGVATRLLDWLEVMGRRAGVRRIRLEVRATAEVARRFYTARGFAATARVPRYYDAREDALRLTKTL